MFRSRRGITPLVATVLLVVFSIGLGTLVMSWGEEYIEQKAEFARGIQEAGGVCSALGFSIIRVSGIPHACQAEGRVDLWLDNGDVQDILNVHARIVGSENVHVNENILDSPLERSNAAKVSITHPDIGQILQVRLVPKVYSDRQVQLCDESAITIERLPPCQ